MKFRCDEERKRERDSVEPFGIQSLWHFNNEEYEAYSVPEEHKQHTNGDFIPVWDVI